MLREVIVIDDNSSDDSVAIAKQFNTTVIALDNNHDANYCRNLGAKNASGDILLFLDSDVILRENTIHNILLTFENASIDAAIGIYSLHHPHKNIASQYKNIWIRYSFLQSTRNIDWLFGAVTAIRKEVFWHSGGFDGTMKMHKGGEDLEFGRRVKENNFNIILNPDIEVVHLKKHTLFSLLNNDFHRSEGFVRLSLNQKAFSKSISRGFVNIYPSFILSVMVVWFVIAGIIAAAFGVLSGFAASISFIIYILLNGKFLWYVYSVRGISFTLQSLGITILDHMVCSAGVLNGVWRHRNI